MHFDALTETGSQQSERLNFAWAQFLEHAEAMGARGVVVTVLWPDKDGFDRKGITLVNMVAAHSPFSKQSAVAHSTLQLHKWTMRNAEPPKHWFFGRLFRFARWIDSFRVTAR